jgi:hypothetical protein
MDHETTVKEYLRLREQREQLDQQMDLLKTELRALGEGSHPIAGVTVSITPNRRIDPKLMAAQFPIAQHPELWKASPDTTAIRKHLAPIRVEQLMTSAGELKIVIR